MELLYDHDHFIAREKTIFSDETGTVRLWGISDFAFKHRTRIFDANDTEIAYVQKDISAESDVVIFCDPADHPIGKLTGEGDHYVCEPGHLIYAGDEDEGRIDGLMEVKKGVVEVTDEKDLLTCMMVLFSLVEIQRRD